MKNLILFITLVVSSISYSQKHSVFGGNIEVTQIGSNQFIMSASVQIDSFNVSSMAINAFDNATDTFVKTFTISLDSSAIIPLRYQTHVIDSLYVNYLSDTFNLSNNPNGYYFVNNEFSKIKGLNNFENANYIFTCQIPNPAILAGNTNPRFSNFHDSLHIIINEIRNLNFSCFDSDGDSLKYSFIQAYDAFFSIGTGSRPFNLISFRPAYNLLNLLGPAGIGSINTNNGFTSIKAIQFGKFTLAVRCEEFRNGIKIGEVVRDLQLIVTDCGGNSLPTLSGINGAADSLGTTGAYKTTACVGQQICFYIQGFDKEAVPSSPIQDLTINWNFGVNATFVVDYAV
ncbi:MAG: hypothetical protein ACPGVD_07345, partial [Flavobacteriales bacterium]